MTTQRRTAAHITLLAIVAGAVAACSTSSDSSSTGEAIPTAEQGLAGTYVTDDADAPFASLTIVDGTRYITEPTGGCPTDDDCRAKGTYTVRGSNITLKDDLSDATQTFPIAILDSGPVTDDGTGDDEADAATATTDDDAGTGTLLGQSEDVTLHVQGGFVGSSSLFASNQVYGMNVSGRSYYATNSYGQRVTRSNSGTLVTRGNQLISKTLLFEGTCNFLHSCSSFSKRLPVGKVSWGCVGVRTCSDSDHWLAAPSRAYCGKTVTICKGSQCSTGKVLDVSNAHAWEGSEGMLSAVGLSYKLTGKCSGVGGGPVTIKD